MVALTPTVGKPALTRPELISSILIAAIVAAPAVPAFADDHVALGFATLTAGLFSLWGLLAIRMRRSTTWLWAAIGLDLLGALGMIWFFGRTFGLGAALMIAYGIASARRLAIQVITWRGVLAECAGFCGPILIF